MAHEANDERSLAMARRVLQIEAAAVTALAERLGPEFAAAVALILDCRGRVIVSGIGKSGHIARKIAATMASTGTPAYFVPLVKRQGGRLIAVTGNDASSLAREADIHLDARVDEEACPLNLAPTASTTAALALGDALAVALLDARGFGAEDFARSHPGGALGRRLLTHVRDVMRPTAEVPKVSHGASLPEALLAMTRGGMGMVAVLDDAQRLLGIFTDGDLRRAMEKLGDLRTTPVGGLATRNPRAIGPDRLAVEAVEMMERHKINQLLVMDEAGNLCGALDMHDLFRAKVV